MKRAIFGSALALAALAGVPAMAQSANSGKQVFDQWCAACHAAGPRFPGTASLAVKYGKDVPAALEQRTDLSPEIVSYFVRHGVLVMPPFRKTEISDADLKALGEYLSRAR